MPNVGSANNQNDADKKPDGLGWGLYLSLIAGLILIASSQITIGSATINWSNIESNLSRDFGIALVIAFLIGFSVERSTRKQSERIHNRQMKDVQKNVFRSSFGITIEPTVLDEVYETVFRMTFMRRGLRIVHEFAPSPKGLPSNGEKYIELTTTVEYKLFNMSKEAVQAEIQHYFEVFYPRNLYASDYTGLCITDPQGNKVLDLADPRVKCNDSHSKKTDPLRRWLDIKPTGKTDLIIQPSSFLKVQYQRKTIKREADLEIYVTTKAADGFTLEAKVDPALNDYLEFFPDASHRQDPVPAVDLPGIRRWEIKAGVLPSQGIILFWKPKAQVQHEASAAKNGAPSAHPVDEAPSSESNGTTRFTLTPASND